MTDQTIVAPRISEDPDNFRAIFNIARDTATDVRGRRMEPAEATAVARNATVAERVLQADLKGRVIDARLAPRGVTRPALTGPAEG